MNVKGGIAYIDFNYLDVFPARTIVIENIYKYFNNAYNSRKIVVLRNLTYSGEKLCDMVTFGIRKKSNSEYVTVIYGTYSTADTAFSRHLSISSDNTVTINS